MLASAARVVGRHHRLEALSRHMGVNGGGADVCVAQQQLDCAQIGTVVEQMGRNSVAQGVGRPGGCDARLQRKCQFRTSTTVAHLLLRLRHSTCQVEKHLWAYIKEKGLQDPKDGRRIILDDKLSTIFPGTSVNMFKMNKHLSKHCKTEGERWLCCIVSWSLHYVT
jgi:hypothetical protein